MMITTTQHHIQTAGQGDVHDITDVVAYFNYTNRMTHGLGMQPNTEYFSMNRHKNA